MATNQLPTFAILIFGGGQTQCLPLYRYENGERVENITDWAFKTSTLQKFQTFVKLIQVNRKPLETLLPKRKNASEAENEQLLQKICPEIKLRVKEGIIEIYELTSISNIPAEVWEYKLGNRTAVEWVLDQYKPYKSSEATIQKNFNTYDFFDYKEQVITLLLQVIYVSVETMKIVKTL